MLLHDVNDNTIITNLSYLGIYQDKAKKWELNKEINYFWVGTKQKKLTTRWYKFLQQYWKLKIYNPLCNWMGDVCSGIIYLFGIKYWWRNVHCKMGDFSFILWRLLVPLLSLFNSPSAIYMLGYNGVRTRDPTFVQIAKEKTLHNKFKNYNHLWVTLPPPPRSDPTNT